MSEIRAEIKVTGTDKKEIRKFIEEILEGIEAQMKLSMTETKTGKLYKRGSVIHQASAPGQAPAVDTGFLGNSIQTKMISDTHGEITISADYAEFLEEGTSTGLAPRPFVEPAIEGVIEKFNKGGGIISRAA